MTVTERNILPADPKPYHYKISITPNFDLFTFEGHVDISLIAVKPQKYISFNYNELTFNTITIATASGSPSITEIPVSQLSLNDSEMKATIFLEKEIVGEAVLSIDYSGVMNDKLAGFYRSKYTVKGEEAYMGTTQFEAVDARRAFPCWDEPAVKAVFLLDVTAPSNMMVLANTLHNKKEENGNKTRWFFDPTPIMSTYLLAWTIGEFEYIEKRIKKTHKVNGNEEETILRVYTPEGKKSQGHFALDVACRVLPLYEKFFESNYFLPKVDLLAVPDFAAGAMENWGLITYREVALLCDETSSASHRQYVALVVAHELAHQWFGNLVTMDWWKELWLNESFATFMQYWSVDKLFPEWHVFTQFVRSEITRALELDALKSSHPVEVDVQKAQEIDSIFDAISYSKGGSIIRMVINYIGDEAFQKGMAAYLKHFAFANAKTVDLWNFLGNAAGKPLAPVLELWTGKQGYPYLKVTSSSDKKQITVTQNRFLSAGSSSDVDNTTIWKIPLIATTPEGGLQRLKILEERESSFSIPLSTWVYVNSGRSAFCRVLYEDNELFLSLLPAISSKQLSIIDRLAIVSDYHAFARAGYSNTVDALKLLLSYVNEDDYTVWCTIADFESDLRKMVESQGEEAIKLFNIFCRNLYSSALEKMGLVSMPDDDHLSIQLRAVLFSRLAAAEDENVIAHALALYDSRKKTPIPGDFRLTTVSVYVKKHGRSALEEVKKMAEDATESMERTHYLRALASSKLESIVHELFEFALSDKVRSQDAMHVFSGLASNPRTSKDYAMELVKMWPALGKKFPGLILGRLLSFLGQSSDVSIVQELETFWNGLNEQEKMGMSSNFQQGMEGIRNNSSWVNRDVKAVVAFLVSTTQ